MSSHVGETSSNSQQNGANGGGKAKAVFNFTSDCDEELSLQVCFQESNIHIHKCLLIILWSKQPRSFPFAGGRCYNQFAVCWWRVVPGWLKGEKGSSPKELCASTGITRDKEWLSGLCTTTKKNSWLNATTSWIEEKHFQLESSIFPFSYVITCQKCLLFIMIKIKGQKA